MKMLYYFLAEEAEPAAANPYTLYIIMGVIVVAFILFLLFSGRKNKQRQKEYAEQIAILAPGHKIKTIGGICGVVVEVCDDNTIIIESGSEQSGKSYIKIDKEFIAQTDAKGPTQLAREEAEAQKANRKNRQSAEKTEPKETTEPKEEPIAPKEEAPAQKTESGEEK